eukprot:CAMPEP_0185841754 /NCGR_PEP_ID=MMETSP1353-20130828/18058_1 /TAXON_ID=1077150 /ORGANISM="Erythrolobus australicus, Strain CCMP3124" /LENGTH=442 /DNA_ID=CAMNT_0028541241 /DNA_START=73 /DNA_END=1401 /DNA_ORIENTATION=-
MARAEWALAQCARAQRARPRLLASDSLFVAALLFAVVLASLFDPTVSSPYVQMHRAKSSNKDSNEHAHRDVASSAPEVRLGVEAYKCTADQAERQVLAFLNLTRDRSGCSAEKYLDHVRDAFPTPEGKLFVNVGANKGDVIAQILDLWAPAPGFRYDDKLLDFWRRVENLDEKSAVGPCGLAGRASADALDSASGDLNETAITAARKNLTWPHVVGVEMMFVTYEALNRGFENIGLYGGPGDGRSVRLVHRGISDQDGELFIQSVRAGTENRGEAWFRAQQAKLQALHARAAGGDPAAVKEAETRGLKRIQLSTFDTLARDTFLPDESLFMLIVDTEGNDPKVLKTAMKTLAKHDTAVVIFEYHHMWKTASPMHSLRGTLDLLESIGYECFFTGSQGLWRLTNCWNDMWDFQEWSNVMCLLSNLEGSQQVISNLDVAPRFAQ